MDERLSDFDDIFIFFIKLQRVSCPRLGSKYQHKLAWPDFFFMYALTNSNIAGIGLFKAPCLLLRVIEDFFSGLCDANGPEKK